MSFFSSVDLFMSVLKAFVTRIGDKPLDSAGVDTVSAALLFLDFFKRKNVQIKKYRRK